MKKILSLIVVTTLIISFQSPEEWIRESMRNSFKQQVEDRAFKNNGTVIFHNLKLLEYEVVSELLFDSLDLLANHHKEQAIIDRMDVVIDEMKIVVSKMEYCAAFWEDNVMLKHYQNEVLKLDIRMAECNQDNDALLKNDSLISARIVANTEPDSLYLMTFYLKATFEYDNGPYNWLDTVEYFLNKDFSEYK